MVSSMFKLSRKNAQPWDAPFTTVEPRYRTGMVATVFAIQSRRCVSGSISCAWQYRQEWTLSAMSRGLIVLEVFIWTRAGLEEGRRWCG